MPCRSPPAPPAARPPPGRTAPSDGLLPSTLLQLAREMLTGPAEAEAVRTESDAYGLLLPAEPGPAEAVPPTRRRARGRPRQVGERGAEFT